MDKKGNRSGDMNPYLEGVFGVLSILLVFYALGLASIMMGA